MGKQPRWDLPLSVWLTVFPVYLFVCLSVYLYDTVSWYYYIHNDILYISYKHFWLLVFSFSGRAKDSSGNSKSLFQFCQWPHQTQSGEYCDMKTQSKKPQYFSVLECAYYTHSMSGNQNWAALLKLRQCLSCLQLASSNT